MSWFFGDREIRQSDVYKMSHYGDIYQLDISRVSPSHEAEYSCVATNSAGMVTCTATLNLDGEYLGLSEYKGDSDETALSACASLINSFYLSDMLLNQRGCS